MSRPTKTNVDPITTHERRKALAADLEAYLAAGKTNREIADTLSISVKTVDTHRGHVLKKLRLRNNSDITRFAISNGLINV